MLLMRRKDTTLNGVRSEQSNGVGEEEYMKQFVLALKQHPPAVILIDALTTLFDSQLKIQGVRLIGRRRGRLN